MASYSQIENKILGALSKAFVDGRDRFIAFDFSSNDPDNETEKRILANLKAERSIETDGGSTVARFTPAGYNKYKDRIAAAEALG